MKSQLFVLAASLAVPGVVNAQSVTFTVKDGRALIVGGETELGSMLHPTTMDSTAIVAAFDALCLPDPGTASARASGSSLGLRSADALLTREGKNGEARVARWVSDSATLTLWAGDETNLKGRSIAITSRAYTTMGPYGPFKAFGTQCNLVTRVADFAAAKAVTDALAARYGTPGKLVLKNTFADGYWQVGGVRVNLNVPTTRTGPQPLHISAQAIPAKGKK